MNRHVNLPIQPSPVLSSLVLPSFMRIVTAVPSQYTVQRGYSVATADPIQAFPAQFQWVLLGGVKY